MKDPFPYPLYAAEHPETNKPVVGFSHDSMFIFDPFLSDCGRFRVEPSTYGLTLAQAERLTTANRLIEQAAEDALNAGCLTLQDALGIKDGGFAGMYFSDDAMWRDWVCQAFAQYISAQLNFGE